LAISYGWKPHDILMKITTLRDLGSCSQAYSFATITMYSWWQPSEYAWLQEPYFWRHSSAGRDLCQINRRGFHPYDIAKFRQPLCRDSVVSRFKGTIELVKGRKGSVRLQLILRPTKAILQGNRVPQPY